MLPGGGADLMGKSYVNAQNMEKSFVHLAQKILAISSERWYKYCEYVSA